MNTDTRIPDLTRSEYEVLRVLWKGKVLSVREVHDKLTAGWAYSTTKTVMDRMVKKVLLSRENFHGVYIYKPLISRPAGLVKMLKFFADSVLEMDYDMVVSMFARSQHLSKDELEELNELIELSSKEE
jgi:predicted transcriptional regulator